MRILSWYPLIRYGHFRWCRDSRHPPGAISFDCFQCKARGYLFVLVLNIAIATLEFWGSGVTQSLALFGDAWHVAFDGGGNFIGWIAMLQMMQVAEDRKRADTYRRAFELLMAIFIIFAAALVIVEASGRLKYGPPMLLENGALLGVALVGLLGNGVALLVFWKLSIGHTHDEHGCSADDHRHSQSQDDILWANILHTLQDTISSILVVTVALLALVFQDPTIRYLDVFVSGCLSVALLWQGSKMIAKHYRYH